LFSKKLSVLLGYYLLLVMMAPCKPGE